MTWGCTDQRLKAIAPYYGGAPRPRAAIRRLCPVVGSWPDHDVTTRAAGVLESELTAAGIPHDLKVYPGGGHASPWAVTRRVLSSRVKSPGPPASLS